MINLGKNTAGVEFAARIINQGDKYGRNDCLTHTESKPLIEFWDMDMGVFVSSYYVDTLTGECEFSHGDNRETGINLEGSVSKWFVTPEQVQIALAGF